MIRIENPRLTPEHAARLNIARDHILTFPCRNGLFSVFRFDQVIGRSMQTYGEWAQSELELLFRLLPAGSVVIDAGANIGTHTLALSAHVGTEGRVYAFEPQPQVCFLLEENVAQNRASNVVVRNVALSDKEGSSVFMEAAKLDQDANFGESGVRQHPSDSGTSYSIPASTIDAFHLDRCDLIKCDVEGMEPAVLAGAQDTLERCRPSVYAECRTVDDGLALLQFFRELKYSLWVHVASVYNPVNCFGNPDRIFGLATETNLLAIPQERVTERAPLISSDASLITVTSAHELCRAILDAPRWGEPSFEQLTRSGLIAMITRGREDKLFLENRVRELHSRITDLSGQAEELQKHKAEKARQARESEIEKQQLRLQLAETEDRYKEVLRRANTLQTELSSLHAELADEAARDARLVSEVSALNQLHADPIHSVRSIGEERDRLRRVVRSLQNRLNQSAAARNEEAQAEQHRNEQTLLDLNRQISEVKRLQLQLDDSQRQVRELRNSLSWRWTAPVRALAGLIVSGPRQESQASTTIRENSHGSTSPASSDELSASPLARSLFDESWYRRENGLPEATDAFDHYIRVGRSRGLNPHPLFDASWYLETNPDVRAAGTDPFVHYIETGVREGRDPHPLFDTSFYLDRHEDLQKARVHPFVHFVQTGWREHRDPHPLFSAEFYSAQKPDCPNNPLIDFMQQGFRNGLDPHPLFDSSFYMARHPELKARPMDGLTHFLRSGASAGDDPHPLFSTSFYAQQYPQSTADGLNPLVHFVLQGRQQGLQPAPVFDLIRHQRVLTEFDRLRMDGKAVVLAVSHIGGGGTEKHVRELQRYVSDRCHVYLLNPANHFLLGESVRGLVQLAPVGAPSESTVLFHPAQQIEDLLAVLRGIGTSRVHVHHIMGHEHHIRPLIEGLRVPFDVTVHDYYLLSPQAQLVDAEGRYAGEPDEELSQTLTRGSSVNSLSQWRKKHEWLLVQADRVLSPSNAAAALIRRYYPDANLVVAAHPDLQQAEVSPLIVNSPGSGKLRVLLIGELSIHKGRRVVEECGRKAAFENLPIDIHLIGFPDQPLGADALITEHGRYRDVDLAERIAAVDPHVIWFPALWPETFVYTLSAALNARRPVVATAIGAFPERLGGREWTWVVPHDLSTDQWCELLLEIRDRLNDNHPPEPPPVLPRPTAAFYDSGYIA